MSKRLQGCFFLAAGVLLAYLFVYSPLQAASREQHVSISFKGAALVPVAVGLGLVYLVLGEGAVSVLGPPERFSWVGWLFVLVCFAVGILLYLGLEARLEQAGYQFK